MQTPSEDEAWLVELLGPEPEFPPYDHQAEEFDQHRDTRCRALLWSMRTGKSRSVIEKANYQFEQGNIEGVILFAPNGIHLNWTINEIPRWCKVPHVSFGWETPKRGDFERIAALDGFMASRSLKWLTINMEALNETAAGGADCIKAIKRFKQAVHGKFMMVISEAHHFGHAGAKRTKLARNLAKKARFITLETGTPILNSPLRWYAMGKIMDDLALGEQWTGDCYKRFEEHFCEFEEERRIKGRRKTYRKVKAYKNLDEIKDMLAGYASVVLRDQVKGMPELLSTERLVVMSDEQRRAYLEMVSRHLVEIEGEIFAEAPDGGPRMIKLQQILNGYVKDGDEIITIDENAPIYRALCEEVYGTLPGKSIVWCRYREDIRRCVAKLSRWGFKCLEFHGGVPTSQREGIRVAFQTDRRYTVLVGQPGAGGEGRDFSAADAIIFFSSTPNAIHYAQAIERGTLVGGTSTTIVRIRTRGTVDDRIWDIVDGKTTLADSISGAGLRDMLMQTDV